MRRKHVEGAEDAPNHDVSLHRSEVLSRYNGYVRDIANPWSILSSGTLCICDRCHNDYDYDNKKDTVPT
eukprot:429279-Amphidinium_carterae.1